MVLWDDNRISIEGDTAVAFTEDVAARYRAYGWHVQSVDLGADGSVDVHALADAMAAARDERSAPSLIQLRTVIAWPAPTLQNTGKSHGSALGAAEVAATKQALGMDPEVAFAVDDEVLAHAREVGQRGAALRAEWELDYQRLARGRSRCGSTARPARRADSSRTAGATRCRPGSPGRRSPRGSPPRA